MRHGPHFPSLIVGAISALVGAGIGTALVGDEGGTVVPYGEQFPPAGRDYPIPADEKVRLHPAHPNMGDTTRWSTCAGGDLFRVVHLHDTGRALLLVSRDVAICERTNQ